MAGRFKPTGTDDPGAQPLVAFRDGDTIQAHVCLDFHHLSWPGSSYVRIRKMVVHGGRIDHKEALTLGGQWITVPEGAEYPPETRIPLVSVLSKVEHQLF